MMEAVYHGIRCGVIHPGYTDTAMVRALGEKFINDRLNPIVEPMIAAAQQDPNSDFDPPSRETWYELHDSLTG